MKRIVVALLLAWSSAVASSSFAQDEAPLPESTPTSSTAASTGSTDISVPGFGAYTDEEEQSANDLAFALGGLFSSGNANSIAITSSAKVRIRRFEHQVTAAAAVNFARAKAKDQPTETTVENYQGLARYDYFLAPQVSLFAQDVTRRDRFQGLDLRTNADPGVAYHFIQTKNQRLVGELGYDFQYDVRRDASRETTASVEAKTRTLHDARAFLGYENKLYPDVSFLGSLEHIQAFEDLDLYRLVFDVGLTWHLKKTLGVAGTYTMRFENKPLAGLVNADSLASISLVYTPF